MDKVGKWAALALMGAALVCGGFAVNGFLKEHNAGDSYKKLQAEAEIAKPQKESTQETVQKQEPEEKVEEPEPVECPVDFDQITEECPDCYAWIRIPDTNIDYPIVQSPSDNTFYLDHNSYGDYEYAGAIFTENLNAKDFSDPNTVIYGHNMRDGSYFGNLKEYHDRAYLDSHREIDIYTPSEKRVYDIFGAVLYDDRYITQRYKDDNPADCEAFLASLNNGNEENILLDDIPVSADSHILTLSTCTGDDTTRFLILAVERTPEGASQT